MPTYILLSSLTPEGSQTLHKDPERLDAVNKEISEFGCKVVTQYAVLGGYDFVTIGDAPDNETVADMSVDLSSRGTVKITTLPAIPVTQLKSKLKGPKQMGKRDLKWTALNVGSIHVGNSGFWFSTTAPHKVFAMLYLAFTKRWLYRASMERDTCPARLISDRFAPNPISSSAFA